MPAVKLFVVFVVPVPSSRDGMETWYTRLFTRVVPVLSGNTLIPALAAFNDITNGIIRDKDVGRRPVEKSSSRCVCHYTARYYKSDCHPPIAVEHPIIIIIGATSRIGWPGTGGIPRHPIPAHNIVVRSKVSAVPSR